MKKRIPLLLSLFLAMITSIMAQPCDIPPATNNCENAPILCNFDDLDGYCTSMSSVLTFNAPSPLCNNGGAPHNPLWFAFYAGCTDLQVTIHLANCDTVSGTTGVQGAIYGYAGNGLCTNSTEQPAEILDCDGACPNDDFLTLNPSGMTIGHIYYFMIDGCAGSSCDLTVTVDNKCGEPYIDNWPEPIDGPLLMCTGATGTYTIEAPNGAIDFWWYLDGVEISVGSDNFVEIQWPSAGTYELCVDASNQCVSEFENPPQTCITIEVYDVTPEDPPPVAICEDDTYMYNGVAYPPGVHDVNVPTAQGCDSMIVLTVDPVLNVDNDLGFYYVCESGGTITVAGNIYSAADQGPHEVVMQQFAPPNCDSTLLFEIVPIVVDPYVDDPLELGCGIFEVTLDGSLSQYQPFDAEVTYQWSASAGGVLGTPSDQSTMIVENAGNYCMRMTVTDPNGIISCVDSFCVTVIQNVVPDISATADTITCLNPLATLVGSTMIPNPTYEWNDPNGFFLGNTSTIQSGEEGIHTFIVTDDKGCSNLIEIEVLANIQIPDIEATANDSLDCKISTVQLNGNSFTPGTIFQWKNSAGDTLSDTKNASTQLPGIYTFFVIAPNGCEDSLSVFVDQDVTPPLPTASTDTLTCLLPMPPLDGGSDLPNGVYLWTGPNGFTSNMEDDTAPAGGDYTLTVTNPDNGCTADTTVTVEVDIVPPDVSAQGDTLDCVITTIALNGNSSTPGATYQWFDPAMAPLATTPSINVTNPGIYTLTVTGPNGCTQSTTAEAVLNAQIPDINITQTDDTITCLVPDIDLTGSSSVNVTYAWTDGNNQPVGSNPLLKVTTAGSYTLLITAANGCSNTQTIDIGEDLAPPVIDNVAGGVIDCATDSIQLSASSSTPGVSYQWFNAGGVPLGKGPMPFTKATGTFTLVVTAYNGCTSSMTATVTSSPDKPQNVVATTSGPITCAVQNVNINVTSSTPGLTYSWSGPAGFNSGMAMNTVALNGNYSVTVTDPTNGCTEESAISVPIDTIHPKLTPTGDLITCASPSADISVLSVPNTVNYAWTDPANAPVGGNTPALNVTTSGTYLVAVTNPVNGCVTSVPVIVTEDTTQPDLAPLQSTTITCTNPSATINATTMTVVNFAWMGPDINGGNANVEDPNVTQPGNYSVVITNPVNGCTNTASIQVIEDKVDPQVAVAGGLIDCTTPSRTLTGVVNPNTNVSLEWQLNGTPLPDNTPSIQASQPGVYTLIVTNQINGCVSQDTAEVVLDDQTPDVTASSGTLTCLVPDVDIIAMSTTPGVTYSWSGPNGFAGTNPVENVNVAGMYTVIVTAPNGCTNTAMTEVLEEKDYPTAVAASSNIIDCTNQSTTLSSAGSSTGTDYTYSWTDPTGAFLSSASSIPNVTLVGTYTLSITNIVSGCTANTTVDVEDNQNLPTGLDVELSDPRCFGFKDGSISILGVTGGTPTFLYSLNGGPFTPNPQFSGLGEGGYTITVQDAAGCLYTAPELDLEEPDQLLVELGEDFILQWGRDTFLYALISPPNALLESITWTPTGVDTTFNNNEILIKPFNQTLYGVTVVDSAGCRAEDQILVLVEKRRPIFIPTAFHPGGEQNTRFYIQTGQGITQIEKMEVFNRWGERVWVNEGFQPNDPAEGWDGNVRGEPANPEVFVYYAKILFDDGVTILYKGDVTLMR
ncbi:MAG: gliding motility-associated C-terminal domain-containing protein [Saprospiraceae bacterium]|nr:gliding motility-associated C-terminal domain-containing protein [Saprospiraceae bacterium]